MNNETNKTKRYWLPELNLWSILVLIVFLVVGFCAPACVANSEPISWWIGALIGFVAWFVIGATFFPHED